MERELAAQGIEVTYEVVRMLVVLVRMWADPNGRQRIKVPEPAHVRRPEEVERLRQPPPEEWPPRLNVRGSDLARRLVGG